MNSLACRSARSAIKSRLQLGQTVRGLFVCTYDATLCEFIATLGWDFLLLDAEHGPIDARAMEHVARACELRDADALARIPLTAAADMPRFLDAGARGVMVPMVAGPSEARRAIELMKYPPIGRRGLGAPRSAGFAVDAENASAVVARSNSDTLIVIQIESAAGVEHVMPIAALDDVDVIFIGPADLSLSIGVPYQWEHPRFIEAVRHIADAARRHGKALGAYAGTPERSQWYESIGARFIAAALEDVLISGSRLLKGS